MRVEIGHSGGVRGGLDGRTVAIAALAVAVAVVLGAAAGTQVGAGAGVLAALAGLVAPAVLAVAVERRARHSHNCPDQAVPTSEGVPTHGAVI